MTRTPLVVIGASAGGPAAIAEILRGLPADLPAAVVVVQHIDEIFAPGLVSWLGGHGNLPVRLAVDGDPPTAGEVVVAGGPHHLALGAGGRLRYQASPRATPYRPSIDVMFETAAREARGFVAGVLLTGMGRDGATGLKALRHAGAFTVVQDRTSSAIYGMPRAALALDAGHLVLPLDDIAARLVAALAVPQYSTRSVRRG